MINAIFASDFWGGMGFNGTLPWPHNAHDLAHFQKQTTNHVVVMGRKTWDDPKMPKPLPGRIVYVASNRPVFNAGRISGDIREQVLNLEQKHPDRIVWVIGGPNLLIECIDILDKVYLTHFQNSFKVDTKIDLKVFLRGFQMTGASVAPDFKSTMVTYAPIFGRTKTGT
jgi:dihydrofolate reductase